MAYTKDQVNRIRTVSLTATDFETDLLAPLVEYDDVMQRDPITGDNILDPAGDPMTYEVPQEVLDYVPTIRKLTLDVTENCNLIINDEYFNPILIRTGSLTSFDYEDVNIKSLKLQKLTPLSKDIIVYLIVGI